MLILPVHCGYWLIYSSACTCDFIAVRCGITSYDILLTRQLHLKTKTFCDIWCDSNCIAESQRKNALCRDDSFLKRYCSCSNAVTGRYVQIVRSCTEAISEPGARTTHHLQTAPCCTQHRSIWRCDSGVSLHFNKYNIWTAASNIMKTYPLKDRWFSYGLNYVLCKSRR